jgi:Putative MetA-pathway of phenol degradation
MFKKIGYVMLTGLLPFSPAAAQELERMETDRPDQTECPFIVPKKWMQAEWGFNYEKTSSRLNTFIYPTLLTKYGVGKKLELRLITTLIAEREHHIPGPVTNAGLEPVEIGFKTALLEEKGVIPKTSLIAHIAIPELSSAKFKTDKWAPNFVFTMQHTISSSLAVGYNLGAAWDGFTNTPYWIYRFSPGVNIGERFYAYAEAFGFIQRDETANHNIDGGLAYYFNNDLKLDLSAGKGLSASSVNYYIALGASFRFRL